MRLESQARMFPAQQLGGSHTPGNGHDLEEAAAPKLVPGSPTLLSLFCGTKRPSLPPSQTWREPQDGYLKAAVSCSFQGRPPTQHLVPDSRTTVNQDKIQGRKFPPGGLQVGGRPPPWPSVNHLVQLASCWIAITILQARHKIIGLVRGEYLGNVFNKN